MIGQFRGRQKTNVYGWVSDLAVARSGFNQIEPSLIYHLSLRPLFCLFLSVFFLHRFYCTLSVSLQLYVFGGLVTHWPIHG